jgi:NAD(P)-dependent dehydrogenase (short-subunit alcohol dehydrogenase family)
MAEELLGLGANLVLIGRTSKRLEKTAHELGSEENILTLPLDVRDAEGVKKGMGKAMERFGKIDGLINNAAGNFLCPTENLSINGFNAIVNTVLNGTFYCTLSVGKHMIQTGGGVILNILANYAETGASYVIPSAVAKAGVLNLTRSLAVEWGKFNIRLNAIAPGPTPTEGAWKALMPDPTIEEMTLSGIPLKRFGQPKEMALLACYLLSDAAAYITGNCVLIDGGQSLSDNPFNRLAVQHPDLLKAFLKEK